jgi:nitroreductase
MTDAIIALTYFDLAAPSFGIGTCWAGFLSIAASSYEPLVQALALPPGRKCAFGLMFGYPQYQFHHIPERNPLQVAWR